MWSNRGRPPPQVTQQEHSNPRPTTPENKQHPRNPGKWHPGFQHHTKWEKLSPFQTLVYSPPSLGEETHETRKQAEPGGAHRPGQPHWPLLPGTACCLRPQVGHQGAGCHPSLPLWGAAGLLLLGTLCCGQLVQGEAGRNPTSSGLVVWSGPASLFQALRGPSGTHGSLFSSLSNLTAAGRRWALTKPACSSRASRRGEGSAARSPQPGMPTVTMATARVGEGGRGAGGTCRARESLQPWAKEEALAGCKGPCFLFWTPLPPTFSLADFFRRFCGNRAFKMLHHHNDVVCGHLTHAYKEYSSA